MFEGFVSLGFVWVVKRVFVVMVLDWQFVQEESSSGKSLATYVIDQENPKFEKSLAYPTEYTQ